MLLYLNFRVVCKTGPSLLGPHTTNIVIGNRAGVTRAQENFAYKVTNNEKNIKNDQSTLLNWPLHTKVYNFILLNNGDQNIP